jgi:hypothetical protein
MARAKLVEIAEIAGGFAVIVGLVFVSYEINQNTKMQRITATQTLVLDYESALDIMAHEADAACIYVRGIGGLANLNHVERYRFFVIWFHIFRSAEQLHYYSQEGMVEPRIWRGFERQLNEVSRLPGVQEWWAVRSDWFSDEFQDYINGVIEDGDPVTPQLFEGDDCTKAGAENPLFVLPSN